MERIDTQYEQSPEETGTYHCKQCGNAVHFIGYVIDHLKT